MRKGIILDLLIKTVKPNKSAMIDQRLQNAYEKAIYRIFLPPISWKIGDHVPELEHILAEHEKTSACFVTAYNPASISLNKAENEMRQNQLIEVVKAYDWPYFIGQGEDETGYWPAEASLLLLGLSEAESKSIGQQFGQNAVVFLEIGAPARLLFCSD